MGQVVGNTGCEEVNMDGLTENEKRHIREDKHLLDWLASKIGTRVDKVVEEMKKLDPNVLIEYADEYTEGYLERKKHYKYMRNELQFLEAALARLGLTRSKEMDRKIKEMSKEWLKRLNKHVVEKEDLKRKQQKVIRQNYVKIMEFVETAGFERTKDMFLAMSELPSDQTTIAKSNLKNAGQLGRKYDLSSDHRVFITEFLMMKTIFMTLNATGLRAISVFNMRLDKVFFDMDERSLEIEYIAKKTGKNKNMRNSMTLIFSNKNVNHCAILWLSIYVVFITDVMKYDSEDIFFVDGHCYNTQRNNFTTYLEMIATSLGLDDIGVKKAHVFRARLHQELQRLMIPQDERKAFMGWIDGEVSQRYYSNTEWTIRNSSVPRMLSRDEDGNDHPFYDCISKVDDHLVKRWFPAQSCHSFVTSATKIFIALLAAKSVISFDMHGLDEMFFKHILDDPVFKTLKSTIASAISTGEKKRQTKKKESVRGLKRLLEQRDDEINQLKRRIIEFEMEKQASSSSSSSSTPSLPPSPTPEISPLFDPHLDLDTIPPLPPPAKWVDPNDALVTSVNALFKMARNADFPKLMAFEMETKVFPNIDFLERGFGIPFSTTAGQQLRKLLQFYALLKHKDIDEVTQKYHTTEKPKRATWLSTLPQIYPEFLKTIPTKSIEEYKEFVGNVTTRV